jgi:hypothetical protein
MCLGYVAEDLLLLGGLFLLCFRLLRFLSHVTLRCPTIGSMQLEDRLACRSAYTTIETLIRRVANKVNARAHCRSYFRRARVGDKVCIAPRIVLVRNLLPTTECNRLCVFLRPPYQFAVEMGAFQILISPDERSLDDGAKTNRNHKKHQHDFRRLLDMAFVVRRKWGLFRRHIASRGPLSLISAL